MQEPSLFDSFNARHLTPSQVGRGFIWNDTILEVVKRQNSMLIGPRGSGKTTFLKMLTLPALAHWNDPRRRNIISSMDFLAIYIPSDFSWDAEYRLPVTATVPIELDELITTALFRTQTLRAMADNLYYLQTGPLPELNVFSRIRSQIVGIDFDQVGEDLISSWDIKTELFGLAGLRSGLKTLLQTVQRLAVACAIGAETVKSAFDHYPFLTRFLFDDIVSFCDAFEKYPSFQLKWALCFDELEIAPKAIKQQIKRSFRSFDQRVLLKCSSSLFDEADAALGKSHTDAKSPRDSQDYHQILLSQDRMHDIQVFGAQVFAALCKDRGLPPLPPEDVLGTSFFEDEHEDTFPALPAKAAESARYAAPRGAYYKVFKKLQEKDSTFASYLRDRQIDLEAMNDLPAAKKASLVRKIIGPVSVRAEFLRGDLSVQGGKRSRKGVPQIYSGARAMFSMCEGNPRWLIGLLGPLIDEYRSDERKQKGLVPRPRQAALVERACNRFLSLLASLRVEPTAMSPRSVIDAIETIGDFFAAQFLAASFNPEPIGSFTVDVGTDESVMRLVGKAVNQGALVLIPERGKEIEQGAITDARFRLCHLLAPMFRLPLLTGRPVTLSTILTRAQPLQSALLLQLMEAGEK